ncbi:MAG: MAPEG family protein [Gammaproteobacteria bacterium]|nr:MAPEG family protein [Gammaproteobacteria bacterium]
MAADVVSAGLAPVFVVMLLALLEYFGFAMAVGRARYRYGVKAPATAGNEDFERVYRVQMNTLELLAIFLPSLWAFAIFVSPMWAAGLGVVFIIGRLLFFTGYVKAAEKRSLGFGLSMFPTLFLLIGGLFGAARAMLG